MVTSIYDILPAYKIRPIEFSILECVHLCCSNISRRGLPLYAAGMYVHKTSWASPQEYIDAAEACVTKNWIKVLTDIDCGQDRARWGSDQNQFISECEYMPGNVDFTEEGGELYHRLMLKLASANRRRPYQDIIGYSWGLPCQARMFGVYETVMRRRVAAVRKDKRFLMGGAVTRRIEHIEGPQEIGPWWINRFVQLPNGYRADIYFTEYPTQIE